MKKKKDNKARKADGVVQYRSEKRRGFFVALHWSSWQDCGLTGSCVFLWSQISQMHLCILMTTHLYSHRLIQPTLLSCRKICSTCCSWHSGMVVFTLVLEDSSVPWKAFENFSLCHSKGSSVIWKENICFHNCALRSFSAMMPFFD